MLKRKLFFFFLPSCLASKDLYLSPSGALQWVIRLDQENDFILQETH